MLRARLRILYRQEAMGNDRGDKKLTLRFNSAPQAWNGMVFYGTAGGDAHNVRGCMYALDAETAKPIWQTFMVPDQPTDPVYGTLCQMLEQEMRANDGIARGVITIQLAANSPSC